MFKIFLKTFPNISLFSFSILLRSELRSCKTVLDVGCGECTSFRFVRDGKYTVGVDGFAPAVEKSRKLNLHDRYVTMDVKNIGSTFKKNEFDAVIAIDVIEHLKKKDGVKFMNDLEYIAKKKVIILTPNGFVPQIDPVNRLRNHISGWHPFEFVKRGYRVCGLYGIKIFRKEEAALRFKPKIISGILAEMSHYLYGKNHPASSFSLFAVLDK